MAAFVWGEGGQAATPEEVAANKKIAMALMAKGSDSSPVAHWTQGLARVSEALLGGMMARDAREEAAAGRAGAPTADSLLGMGGAAPAAVAPAASAPAAGVAPVAAGAPADREKQAFDYFVAQGHNPAAAAGIVGNLIQESRLNPAAVNPQDGADGSNSIGVAQWNGPRAIAFKQFAAANKADPNDFNTQLSFVQHELTGPEMRVGQALRNVNDPTAAAGIFAGYERPQGWKEGGDPSAIHGWQNRSGNAARIYAAYGGAVPPQGAPAPLAGPVQVASADPNFVPQNVPGVAPPAAVAPPIAPPAVVAATPAGAGGDPGNPLPPVQRVAQAIAAAPAAPAAAPAPGVQAVAQAMAPQPQVSAALKALRNPWITKDVETVAKAIVAKSMADPNERIKTQLEIDRMRAEAADQPEKSRGLRLGNAKAEADLAGVPLTREGQQLDNAKKRRDLGTARPMSDEERAAFHVPKGVPASIGADGVPHYGPAGTTVKSEGPIPAGMQAIRDENGDIKRYEPIPGSKEAKADATRQQQQEAQSNVVVDAIDQIGKKMDAGVLPVTGGIGKWLSGVPGTQAHDISNLVDTVKANITFARLNEMRQASPTGAALGAVSDTENKLLGASVASLEQSQTAEQFKRNLGIVRKHILEVVHGPGDRPPAASGASDLKKKYGLE